MTNILTAEALKKVIEQLSPTEAQNELAIKRYRSIGKWLNRPESILFQYDVEVYPQGSFNLGTTIRPLGDGDSFDLDLVCQVGASKYDFSQSQLKELVGEEIRSYCSAQNISAPASEGKRCWTIEYADQTSFHIDILPAIPDDQALILEKGHFGREPQPNVKIYEKAIAITDNTSAEFNDISFHWPLSNPRGYAIWFKARQEIQLNALKEHVLGTNRAYATLDEIPDHKVRTTLQQAIQLLKRHRDQMFADDECKPISIIITTLAAKAYNNEADLSKALRSILIGMDQFIDTKNGVKWIANPSNPHENFADRWEFDKEREVKFYKWLNAAQRDFGLIAKSNHQELNENLSRAFSRTTASKLGLVTALAAPAIKSAAEIAQNETNTIKSAGLASKPYGR